jgi:hypothetical protein
MAITWPRLFVRRVCIGGHSDLLLERFKKQGLEPCWQWVAIYFVDKESSTLQVFISRAKSYNISIQIERAERQERSILASKDVYNILTTGQYYVNKKQWVLLIYSYVTFPRPSRFARGGKSRRLSTECMDTTITDTDCRRQEALDHFNVATHSFAARETIPTAFQGETSRCNVFFQTNPTRYGTRRHVSEETIRGNENTLV